MEMVSDMSDDELMDVYDVIMKNEVSEESLKGYIRDCQWNPQGPPERKLLLHLHELVEEKYGRNYNHDQLKTFCNTLIGAPANASYCMGGVSMYDILKYMKIAGIFEFIDGEPGIPGMFFSD